MKNYNLHLISLREDKGLTIKEASKQMKISPLSLYCYEKGYFRPSKKNLKKINAFYGVELSLKGLDGYPAASNDAVIGKKKNLKKKKIIFGSLSAFFAIFIAVGAVLFVKSVNNSNEYYGQTYKEVRNAVIEKGKTGHDLLTGMSYYYVDRTTDSDNSANLIFYQSDNILYFNDLTYSKTIIDEQSLTFDRYLYQLGSNLGVSSYLCSFTYGDLIFGTHFRCEFIYNGNNVTEYSNFKFITGEDPIIDEELVLKIINTGIAEINHSFSELMSDLLDKPVDFHSEFLPAREQGRIKNFNFQIIGLVFLFSGITFFFVFFAMFLRLLILNIKPRLISVKPDSEENKQLPEDLNIRVGIPDTFIVILGRLVCIISLILFILAAAFTAAERIGLTPPTALSNPTLLEVFKTGWISAVFLNFIISVNRIRKPIDLLHKIISNLGMFLFIATIETVFLAITTAWGYDLTGIMFKYIPGNVFQVVAINYVILLFLLFVPTFLTKKKKYWRVIWHSLSLIPLAGLIVIYYFSNRYVMVYGVEQNILLKFWIPNSFLLLSVVSVFYMYIIFFIRLFYERKYGVHNSQFFFHGHRYYLIQNLICAGLIILVASVSLAFMYNQRAIYLGLGNNYWMFILVPLVLFCRYSPNNQQMYLFEYEFDRYLEK